jgi:uncharacterized protein (TIGR03435 family)
MSASPQDFNRNDFIYKSVGWYKRMTSTRILRLALSIVFAAGWLHAQTADSNKIVFEVASVKAAGVGDPAGGRTGGPGTADPGRLTYSRVPIMRLLSTAFAVSSDEIFGPSWVMDTNGATADLFDVVANLPAGTTKEQMNIMLLNLLGERFHLAYHREKREFDAYLLTVAKGGPKLKDAQPVTDGPSQIPPAQAPPAPGTRTTLDRDGFPLLPPGLPGLRGNQSNGVTRVTFRMSTPADLAGIVSIVVGTSRVVDRTGLSGKYDFKLEYATPIATKAGPALFEAVGDSAPDIFSAVDKQLGLKLQKGKAAFEVIVVDRIDRTPVEN